MSNTNTKTSVLFLITCAAASLVMFAVFWKFPTEFLDQQLALIVVLTLVSSTISQIQLPGLKVHVTLSDVLVFFTLIVYGGEIATVLAAAESVAASLGFRRTGVPISARTIILNGAIATVSTYLTAAVVTALVGPPFAITGTDDIGFFVLVLGTLALVLYLVNSAFVSAFTALKSGKPLWEVWYVNCLNGLLLYFTSSFIAGTLVKAFYRLDTYLILTGFVAAGLMYLTIWRYTSQIRSAAAQAELAERGRAELAESHVAELKAIVDEKDRAEIALRESHARFRHAAYHDQLTGLPNKNYFLEMLSGLINSDTGQRYAVLFLDLNRFKRINDSLGHSNGDRLLVKVARLLEESKHPNKFVARFSGDEFGIIVQEVENVEQVLRYAQRLSQAFDDPFVVEKRTIFTSVSIGVVVGDGSYTSAEDVLRDSDIAVYHAKETNRSVVLFDKEMHENAVSLLEIETDIRYAVERDELQLHYQPIVDLKTLEIEGFEALIRWEHPIRGLISPAELIPVCESTGLIVALTRWILQEACVQAVQWNRNRGLDKQIYVSVNLSGRHFDDPDVVAHVWEAVENSGADPALVRVELTESAVMENAELTIAKLEELRALGIRVAIDDFGTGYSTLSYLHRFPIDTVKIDRSFVTGMSEGQGHAKIVAGILAMAVALGLDVVAEGVENTRQMRELQGLGCHSAQGYLFSRPVNRESAARFIEEQSAGQRPLPPADVALQSGLIA